MYPFTFSKAWLFSERNGLVQYPSHESSQGANYTTSPSHSPSHHTQPHILPPPPLGEALPPLFTQWHTPSPPCVGPCILHLQGVHSIKKCKIEFKSHHLQDFPYCPPTLPFPSPPLFFQNHPSPCPWIQCTNYSEITMYLMLKWSNVAFISSGSTASMMWPECVTVSDSFSLDAIYLGGMLERLFFLSSSL